MWLTPKEPCILRIREASSILAACTRKLSIRATPLLWRVECVTLMLTWVSAVMITVQVDLHNCPKGSAAVSSY